MDLLLEQCKKGNYEEVKEMIEKGGIDPCQPLNDQGQNALMVYQSKIKFTMNP